VSSKNSRNSKKGVVDDADADERKERLVDNHSDSSEGGGGGSARATGRSVASEDAAAKKRFKFGMVSAVFLFLRLSICTYVLPVWQPGPADGAEPVQSSVRQAV
jgi:hypothetical protein